MLDLDQFENTLSKEFGLAFEARSGINADGQSWYSIHPKLNNLDHTFSICTTLEWRRILVSFEAGKFAGDLISQMGNADVGGRVAFTTVLNECYAQGAKIDTHVNNVQYKYWDESIWNEQWTRLSLFMKTSFLTLDEHENAPSDETVLTWTKRFVAAVVALLPLEDDPESATIDVDGYPEGAVTTVQVNRYERDRRNRIAALAFHGTSCHGCGIKLEDRYGQVAQGFVEVHHITPVSELGSDYWIDPVRDLIPLCPNCHAITHRRNPPYSIEEIKRFLASSETD